MLLAESVIDECQLCLGPGTDPSDQVLFRRNIFGPVRNLAIQAGQVPVALWLAEKRSNSGDLALFPMLADFADISPFAAAFSIKERPRLAPKEGLA